MLSAAGPAQSGVWLQLTRALAPFAAAAARALLERTAAGARTTFAAAQLVPAHCSTAPLEGGLPLLLGPACLLGGLAPHWRHPLPPLPDALTSVTNVTLQPQRAQQQQLSAKERAMVRLYLAGCLHHWEELPGLARQYLAAGCSAEELRGCVRHLAVFAGYPLCLAATLTLQKAKLLPEDTPAKCGGAPGNAFELVYGPMSGAVRQKMGAADPALGEWIRTHLYGDLYSSPGLDLRQKQLLACAFLGQVGMPQQLLGHCIAALRFGASRDELEEAMRLGIHAAPALSEREKQEAYAMLDKAYAKYQKDFKEQHSPPSITVPDPGSIRIPPVLQ